MKIILASGSLGRRTILESLKIPFEVMESQIDEEKIVDRDPVKMAVKRAEAKALAVAEEIIIQYSSKTVGQYYGKPVKQYDSRNDTGNTVNTDVPVYRLTGIPNFLVIGADTVGFMGGWVFGKPKNRKEAEEILVRLSGKTHKYVSAHCVINFQIQSSKLQDPKISRNQRLGSSTVQQFNRLCGYDISSVTFRKLTAKDISTYLDCVEYKKLCGGIKINDSPQDFVTKIEGSISNVVGLSLEKLVPILRRNFILL